VFGEHHNAEAKSPGVLGIVLGAAALGVNCLAEDFLQLVAFDDEGDLLGEALGGVFGGRNHERHERHEKLTSNAAGGETVGVMARWAGLVERGKGKTKETGGLLI
jgi:hypothetical protein